MSNVLPLTVVYPPPYPAILSTQPVFVPLTGIKISAGFASPAEEYIEKRLSLDGFFQTGEPDTFFQIAQGHCMEPEIKDGDLCIWKKRWCTDVRNGDIVAAYLNGEFTMKRYFMRNGICQLVPDNKDYLTITITEDMDFYVWAVLAGHCRKTERCSR